MIFPEDISKQEIQQLPLLRFPGEIHLIDTKTKLRPAIRRLKTEKYIGFDTEKKPTFLKGQYHPTALVQLSTLEEAFLFRIGDIGFRDGLKDILEEESIKKIGISIRDDLEELKMVSPFNPAGFIDLNRIASEVGVKREGVRNLSAIFLNKRVSKNQQTSNWENEILTEAQTIYAATDAWVCIEIYQNLVNKGFIENGTG